MTRPITLHTQRRQRYAASQFCQRVNQGGQFGIAGLGRRRCTSQLCSKFCDRILAAGRRGRPSRSSIDPLGARLQLPALSMYRSEAAIKRLEQSHPGIAQILLHPNDLLLADDCQVLAMRFGDLRSPMTSPKDSAPPTPGARSIHPGSSRRSERAPSSPSPLPRLFQASIAAKPGHDMGGPPQSPGWVEAMATPAAPRRSPRYQYSAACRLDRGGGALSRLRPRAVSSSFHCRTWTRRPRGPQMTAAIPTTVTAAAATAPSAIPALRSSLAADPPAHLRQGSEVA